MSAPDSLYIRYLPDKPLGERFLEVVLDSFAGEALFEYMLPKLYQLDPEYAEPFEGSYIGGALAIDGTPAKYWHAVYTMIMQACDELERLKPYKEELKAALEADPRFKQAT